MTALQAAWSAIAHTPVPTEAPAAGRFACAQLVDGLEAAVRIGHDTDTVASIAGVLLGARWGASAVPAAWRRRVHGWPDATAEDLVELALRTVQGGPDAQGWPGCDRLDDGGWGGFDTLAVHPFDDGVYLGGAGALDDPPAAVTAVVSLGRLGRIQVPPRLRSSTSASGSRTVWPPRTGPRRSPPAAPSCAATTRTWPSGGWRPCCPPQTPGPPCGPGCAPWGTLRSLSSEATPGPSSDATPGSASFSLVSVPARQGENPGAGRQRRRPPRRGRR